MILGWVVVERAGVSVGSPVVVLDRSLFIGVGCWIEHLEVDPDLGWEFSLRGHWGHTVKVIGRGLFAILNSTSP